MKLLKFFPLIIFLILSVFLYNKIKFKKELEPLSSALVEKKFPNLKIKSLDSNESINNFINNKFVVINIFASSASRTSKKTIFQPPQKLQKHCENVVKSIFLPPWPPQTRIFPKR